MGQGHFKGNETQGQTSGNTVIMVLKQHKFLLSSIKKNLKCETTFFRFLRVHLWVRGILKALKHKTRHQATYHHGY